MFDVGTGKPAAAHYPVARRARPTALDGEFAHAAAERYLPANHSSVATRKTVSLILLNLNAGARAIRLSGEPDEFVDQPIDGRAAQQIVPPPQIEIPCDVCATFGAGALLCLR
jgi:hypothetical protein